MSIHDFEIYDRLLNDLLIDDDGYRVDLDKRRRHGSPTSTLSGLRGDHLHRIDACNFRFEVPSLLKGYQFHTVENCIGNLLRRRENVHLSTQA
jgi:hypothetical protein